MPAGIETEDGSRRGFFLGLIYGMWGIIAALLGGPALAYLFFPPKARTESEWVDAGEPGTLEPDVPVEVVYRRNHLDGWKLTSEKQTAWVVRLSSKGGDQGIVAYGPQCTHLGCAYHWDERRSQFLCPCHSSLFGVDGRVLSGPAPRPLDRYETRIEKGRLLIGRLKPGDGREKV